MDYLIDKYERALKIIKIWTPATLAVLFILSIIGLFSEATRPQAITTLFVVLVIPPAVMFEVKLINKRIDKLENMTVDKNVNVSLLVAKEKYIMTLRSEKPFLVVIAVITVLFMLILYLFTRKVLLAILAPLMIAIPFAIKYLIRRRFLKREIEKAEDFFNVPDNN